MINGWHLKIKDLEQLSVFIALPYLVFWKLIPIVFLSISNGYGLDIAHALSLLLLEFVLILPLLRLVSRGRVSFVKDFLFWVTLINLIVFLAKNPAHILLPILLLQPEFLSENSRAASIISSYYQYGTDSMMVHLIYTSLVVAGYWLCLSQFRYARKSTTVRIENISSKRIFWLIIIWLGIVLFSVGGISGLLSHFIDLSSGRLSARKNIGLALVLSSLLPVVCLLAGFLNPEYFKRNWFRFTFLMLLLLQFLLGGSRSAFVFNIVIYLVVFLSVNGKIKLLPIIILPLAMISIIGLSGVGRSTGGDFSTIKLDRDFWSNGVSMTYEEISQRNINASTRVIDSVEESGQFLLGESYVGALLFFIPRSVWENKPRGGGAYAASIINYGFADRGYTSASYPISAPAELFLNFWFFGVVIGGLLTGLLYAAISRLGGYVFRPLSLVLFLIALITLRAGISSEAIIPFLQYLFIFFVFYVFFIKVKFCEKD